MAALWPSLLQVLITVIQIPLQLYWSASSTCIDCKDVSKHVQRSPGIPEKSMRPYQAWWLSHCEVKQKDTLGISWVEALLIREHSLVTRRYVHGTTLSLFDWAAEICAVRHWVSSDTCTSQHTWHDQSNLIAPKHNYIMKLSSGVKYQSPVPATKRPIAHILCKDVTACILVLM